MVFYFTASSDDDFGISEKFTVYMGKDKFENDPLIKKSHPKHLWFHVDKHSSAHIYLELPPSLQTILFDSLVVPEDILNQMAQLTKANSIKANKLNNITVIYTPVDNLHTDGSMDTGTVTFKNPQKLKRVNVAKKDNAIVNRLNKTKKEVSTEDFLKSQADQIKEWEYGKKRREREQEQEQRELNKQKMEEKLRKQDPYADLMTEENLNANSNEFRNDNWVEDDFW